MPDPAETSSRSPKLRTCLRAKSPPASSTRPRHEKHIAAVRRVGASVRLITDGDVAGVIATTDPATGIDIYIGRAAHRRVCWPPRRCAAWAPDAGTAVLQVRDEKKRATKLGSWISSANTKLKDLAGGDVIFAATGVTDGSMLKGVYRTADSSSPQCGDAFVVGHGAWVTARHRCPAI